ncbi:hypothetical protein EDD85DRAFT_1030019 [Armillaria nabsnona]|nr:hypothetical protein EDD85DRAFT_1030019 [Armillaria nabsnona]
MAWLLLNTIYDFPNGHHWSIGQRRELSLGLDANARVCFYSQYWADVVLDTPVLWSKIAVGPHDSLEKARRKLKRSKSCPLDVFGMRTEYINSIMEQVVHAMYLICPALW